MRNMTEEKYFKPPEHIQKGIVANTPIWLREYFAEEERNFHKNNYICIKKTEANELINEANKLKEESKKVRADLKRLFGLKR